MFVSNLHHEHIGTLKVKYAGLGLIGPADEKLGASEYLVGRVDWLIDCFIQLPVFLQSGTGRSPKLLE